MVIDDTGSVEDIHAFIYCKKWRFGRVSRMPDRLTTLKDRATQLLTKYKSGALVTQYIMQNIFDGDRPEEFLLMVIHAIFPIIMANIAMFLLHL